MTKRYCDACGIEIDRNWIGRRFEGASKVKTKPEEREKYINIEIVAGIGDKGSWNSGDICLRCLIDAVVVAGGNHPAYRNPI